MPVRLKNERMRLLQIFSSTFDKPLLIFSCVLDQQLEIA